MNLRSLHEEREWLATDRVYGSKVQRLGGEKIEIEPIEDIKPLIREPLNP